MNLPYLIEALKFEDQKVKLSDVTAAMHMPPLDMNIIIWDAIKSGEVEIDEEKDKIKVLTDDIVTWHDPDLATKIIRAIQQYADNETNIQIGRLLGWIKDPVTSQGYPLHEFLMTIQHLVDTGTLVKFIVSVPEVKGKRPYHRFVFLGLPENEAVNEEWNAKAVNKWLAEWDNKKVK